ncbi:MAG: ABC transporter permease subunit [Lachnospiraceae bacterium]|nr:ABC transporter permease subunit [Lachnospiraceae bacterium]
MRKNNKKVDVIIVIVILLILAGIILKLVLPEGSGTGSSSANKDVPTSYRDYNGKRLGILTGSSFEQPTFEFFPDSEYFYYDNVSDMVMAIKQDKIDGFLYDEPILRMIEINQPEVTFFREFVKQDIYSFGFQKDQAKADKIREQFNDMLAELEKSGELDGLKSKWFSKGSDSLSLDTSLPKGENGTLNVGTNTTNIPFAMIVDGNISGYAIELMTLFGRKYGYDFKYDQVNPASGLAGLASGVYDVFANNTTVTKERAESIAFSDPIYSGGMALAVRSSDLAQSGADGDGNGEDKGFFAGVADSFEKNFIRESRWKMILQGVGTTCLITVVSALLGTILAFSICMFRRTGSRLANTISNLYVKLLQGTPMVVLLMILYYVVFGKSGMGVVWVAVVGFTLNFGAYASEIMRSGIESIDGGQREAALAIGYSETQAFFRFIFPQAAARFLPVYSQEIVSLLKSTSIVGYIAIQDLTKMSDIIRSRTFEAFFPLIATAVIYFILAWIISTILEFVLKGIQPKRVKK